VRKADNSLPSGGEVKEVLRYISSLRVNGGLELHISRTNTGKGGFSEK